jgi:dynein heavy chain
LLFASLPGVPCHHPYPGKERLESLTLHFAGMLYTGAARSLFDEDKLPFAVLMLARYMLVGVN